MRRRDASLMPRWVDAFCAASLLPALLSAQGTGLQGGRPAAGGVVWLHAAGSSAQGFRTQIEIVDGGEMFRGLEASGVSVYFPESGFRHYGASARPAGRPEKASVWFDETAPGPRAAEDTASVEAAIARLKTVMDKVVRDGTPANRIVVGGYGMGGSLAMQFAVRYPHALGAVFALSSYLCEDAAGFRGSWNRWPSRDASWPQVWMVHGHEDVRTPPAWGESTAKRLRDLGMRVHFETYPGVRAELSKSQLDDLKRWLQDVLSLRKVDWYRPTDIPTGARLANWALGQSEL